MSLFVSETIYKQWLALRYKYLALPQNLTAFLQSLRKSYQIALITNGDSRSQWEKIERLNIRQYFDLILVSGDLPWEKPHKDVFFKACGLLNVSPANCVMVGDKLETDIQGGIDAQLGATVWIPIRPNFKLSKTDPTPTYILNNVMDLKCLLSSLNEKSFMEENELNMGKLALKSHLPEYLFYTDEDSNTSIGSDGS